MLQLLETGKALYVLAVFCGLGIFTRLITGHLYKRLLKESTNLAATRNKNLKELRQRAENTYRMNQGMRDSSSWLENQLNHLKFMGLTLNEWSLLAVRWTWLCLLAGAAASFASYWYHLDTLYIVMYGGSAILMAMLGMMFDPGAGAGKKEQLLAALRDYIENVMCPRLARNQPIDYETGGTEARSGASVRPIRGRREKREIREKEETAHQTDAEYIKQGLEQIAAAKEKPRAFDENWLKNLKPEEMKLLSDILREYLV